MSLANPGFLPDSLNSNATRTPSLQANRSKPSKCPNPGPSKLLAPTPRQPSDLDLRLGIVSADLADQSKLVVIAAPPHLPASRRLRRGRKLGHIANDLCPNMPNMPLSVPVTFPAVARPLGLHGRHVGDLVVVLEARRDDVCDADKEQTDDGLLLVAVVVLEPLVVRVDLEIFGVELERGAHLGAQEAAVAGAAGAAVFETSQLDRSKVAVWGGAGEAHDALDDLRGESNEAAGDEADAGFHGGPGSRKVQLALEGFQGCEALVVALLCELWHD